MLEVIRSVTDQRIQKELSGITHSAGCTTTRATTASLAVRAALASANSMLVRSVE